METALPITFTDHTRGAKLVKSAGRDKIEAVRDRVIVLKNAMQGVGALAPLAPDAGCQSGAGLQSSGTEGNSQTCSSTVAPGALAALSPPPLRPTKRPVPPVMIVDT